MTKLFRFGLTYLVLSTLLFSSGVVGALAAPLRIDCPRGDVNVKFNSPQQNSTVSSLVQVEGSAIVPDLQSYRLEFSTAGRDTFVLIGAEVRQAVLNGQLGVWDSAGVPDGGYTLRLRAFDSQRQYCEAFLNLRVENARVVPPTAAPTVVPTAVTPTNAPTITPEPTNTASPTGRAQGSPTASPVGPLPTSNATSVTQVADASARTPIPSRSTGSPAGLISNLNLDSLVESITDYFRLLGRTFIFGAGVGLGIMAIVAALFFVRRNL